MGKSPSKDEESESAPASLQSPPSSQFESTSQHQDEDTMPVDTNVVAQIAAQLRQGSTGVELQEAPTVPGTTTLLAWGYFNPFGPTASRVDAVPVAGTGEIMLVCASDHPMFPEYHAVALISSSAAIGDALERVFAVNGGAGEWGLVGSAPTYVHLVPKSPIDRACAAELFRSAIASAGNTYGTPTDYAQEIQDLVRAWQDPWAQAAEAVNRSLQGPLAQRLLAQIRQLEAGESPSIVDDDDDGQAPHEDEEDGPVDTDELFDLWFALATQPEYVNRIEGQMGIAWSGALAFQARTW